jgi:hypothetical protein
MPMGDLSVQVYSLCLQIGAVVIRLSFGQSNVNGTRLRPQQGGFVDNGVQEVSRMYLTIDMRLGGLQIR